MADSLTGARAFNKTNESGIELGGEEVRTRLGQKNCCCDTVDGVGLKHSDVGDNYIKYL